MQIKAACIWSTLSLSLLGACATEPTPASDVDATADEFLLDDDAAMVRAAATRTLTVSLEGLEPLGPDYVYEGWLIIDGQAIAAGRFNLRQAGGQVRVCGAASRMDRATAYVLTIEPRVGDVPAPSKVHVLGGDFTRTRTGKAATLTMRHQFGTDFGTATGRFMLETPSSAAADDWFQGVWFLDPSGAAPQPSLNLPRLPEGWEYEGWVVTAQRPVSTGKFMKSTGADSDRGGPGAGPLATPPFPGQDFVTPPVDVRTTTVVISVEPTPDDSAAPFAIKPLLGVATGAQAPGQLQPLSNTAPATSIRGTATMQ